MQVVWGKKEEIVYFTVKCIKLEQKRDPTLVNKEIIDPVERMKEVLFRNNKYLEVSHMIRNMWISRRDQLKEIKERNISIGQSQISNAPKNQSEERATTQQNPPQSGQPQSGQTSESEINLPQSGQGSEPGKPTTEWSSTRARETYHRVVHHRMG